ncbi:MAG TPA: hypothetical protein VIK86_04270 [Candidatus Paceibacterota bacterium]
MSDNISSFKDFIYKQMKTQDIVCSAFKLEKEYQNIYGFDIKKEELFETIKEDSRFISINNNQILLKQTLDNLVSKELHNKSIEEIGQYIKEKYYIQNINMKTLENIFSTSRNIDRIIIRYNNKVYEVRNIEEFYDLALNVGQVNGQTLESIVEFFEGSMTEIYMELDHRNVSINDDLNMLCFITKAYKANTDSVNRNDHNLIKDTEKQLILKVDLNIHNNYTKYSNLLNANLLPFELIACLCLISNNDSGQVISKKNISVRCLNALEMLEIIKKLNKDEYSVTSIGESIANSFHKSVKENTNYHINEILAKYPSTKELFLISEIKSICSINKIWEELSEDLRNIYLSNKSVVTLIELIRLSSKTNGSTLVDIIKCSLYNGKYKEIVEVIIGENEKIGIKYINQSIDTCTKCPFDYCKLVGNKSVKAKKLIHYINKQVYDFLENIEISSTYLNKLNEDPLLIKFIVSQSLTMRAKEIMGKIGIIQYSNTNQNKGGNYCPFKDIWILGHNIS